MSRDAARSDRVHQARFTLAGSLYHRYCAVMEPASRNDSDRRLFGILCTYRRPVEALSFLDQLEQQTMCPDLVVIIDNASDPSLARTVSSRIEGLLACEYIDPGTNVGPAGAFRLGFEFLRRIASPDDLVVHFDDDDPPVSNRQLAQLVDALTAAQKRDASICGVGMSGGLLNRWTGTIRRSDRSAELADVDHLHGGYLPVYTMGGLSAVGSCDPSFFYGFEELELGRRLRAAEQRLMVDNALMATLESRYVKKAPRSAPAHRAYATDNGWSRFHKERNLIRVLRREHLWSAIAFTVVTRYVLKPLLVIPRSPSAGWDRLVLGLRAARAGLAGKVGIDPRYPPS